MVRGLILVLFLLAVPAISSAWYEQGHHLIAVLAYEQLNPAEQQSLQRVLQHHPRFAEDFAALEATVERTERAWWRIGRAAYWPDVARAYPEWNRSSWHYQLGASRVIGDVELPKLPGPLPAGANLDTQELYIAQAIELCRTIWRDASRPDSERAVALCWLAHLVGDAHQPCHAGSLYVAGLFPNGDRGANLIPTKQAKALHLVWDNLLGGQFDANELHNQFEVIHSSTDWNVASRSLQQSDALDPLKWLAEDRELVADVYSPDILASVESARQSKSSVVAPVELTEEYLSTATALARNRAAYAAQRLAAILREGLNAPDK